MWIFFLLSFVFFCFFCYTLPCFLLILGDWACLVICFVVYCYLFILFFFFFSSWIFCCFFFCKFSCSWHFFTSSDHVPPGGLVAQGPRFEDRYRRVVSYTVDDLGKRVAWLTRIDGHGTEETVDDGLGGRCLGAGQCPVAPHSGWSWLDDLGDGVNCFFFFFFFFENSWRLLARCWNGEKFLAQLLLSWNYEARGHICCEPPWGFLPMQHINNCWYWWCSQLQGAPWVWSIVWSRIVGVECVTSFRCITLEWHFRLGRRSKHNNKIFK